MPSSHLQHAFADLRDGIIVGRVRNLRLTRLEPLALDLRRKLRSRFLVNKHKNYEIIIVAEKTF